MELDAMKEVWKEAGQSENALPGNAEIVNMIGKLPNNPVASMKRNIILETTVVVVLFGGVALFYFLAFNGNFNSVAWLYIIMAVLCVVYFSRKWKLLSQMQCAPCQVKSNLTRQVNTLERYIRFYLFAGTAVVPLMFIFLGVLFYLHFPAGKPVFIFPPFGATGLKPWLIWLLFTTIFTALFYAANRWYVHHLYSRHVTRLKVLLNQMEE